MSPRAEHTDHASRKQPIGDISGPLETLRLDIEGMTCAGCAGRVETALRAVPGVVEVGVNFATDRADITVSQGAFHLGAVTTAIRRAGYKMAAPAPRSDTGAKQKVKDRRDALVLTAALLLAAPFFVQMIFMALDLPWRMTALLELALATPVQFILGARFYRAGFSALRHGSANMDVLVALGTSAAYGKSLYLWSSIGEQAAGSLYFEASVMVITLVLLGKFIETRAKRGATSAIRALHKLTPRTVCVLQEGAEVEIQAGDISVDDIMVLRPGDRIAADGEIIEGESDFDESHLTGESIPVVKTIGDTVVTGALVGAGSVHVKTKAVGADTTLARIIDLVENAQAARAPIQKLVDRIAQVFVPITVGISLSVFLLWGLVLSDWETAFTASVAVLVIACPCALGLAAPTAIVVGTGLAAKYGVLVKNFDVLEKAARVTDVVFDKTGTLTVGAPALCEFSGSLEDLRLAASAQKLSEHPLAAAFLDLAKSNDLPLTKPSSFKSFPGGGIQAVVQERSVTIGNQRFLSERGIDVEEAALEALAKRGLSAVAVAIDGRPICYAGLADAVRPTSRPAIEALTALSITPHLYSGDARQTARNIANSLGIPHAVAPMKPEDKAQRILALQASNRVVLMIGDGVNDAPALATADIGIAMGTGTDIAIETSDITLMRADLRLVATTLRLCKATIARVRQNLFWAFAYNALCIPIAAAGLLSPSLAGAAMAMSSLSVVGNALLLKLRRVHLA